MSSVSLFRSSEQGAQAVIGGGGFEGGGGLVAQTIRVTRELFLPDPELRRALGLSASTIILAVVRKQGTYRKGGVVDLQGCLVTVFDPKETAGVEGEGERGRGNQR